MRRARRGDVRGVVALLLAAAGGAAATAALYAAWAGDERAAAAAAAAAGRAQLLSNDSLLEEITGANRQQFVFIPSAALVVVCAAKSASTSLFQFLYRGATGARSDHAPPRCASYVQNVSSACWGGRAVFVAALPRAQQRFVLTSASVWRVAVQRNAFERLLSAYKSKFACDARRFNTNVRNRAAMVPALRRLAALPRGGGDGGGAGEGAAEPCMNVSEFAAALDALQRRGYPLHTLDVHIRPQRLFLRHISYDAVLDVADLANVSTVRALVRRLPYGALVRGGVAHRHVSGSYSLSLHERDARALYRFAAESELAPRKLP